MKERTTTPRANEPVREAAPAYEQISRGLTHLLHGQGQPVRDGSPSGKRLSHLDPATGALVLHPWLPPRMRAEFLLDAAVSRLETVEYERRLAEVADDEDEVDITWYHGDEEPWRAPLVKLAAGRELGMSEPAGDDDYEDELSDGEAAAVSSIVGAARGIGARTAPPAEDDHLEDLYDARQHGDYEEER